MGFYIYHSVITPFAWYSLLPIIGFSAFLALVVAFQRGEFYWLTDKLDDIGRAITSRCRSKPKRGRDAHVPWFVTGAGGSSHYGQTGGMMIPTFQGHLAAAHPEASAQGAAAMLNRDSIAPPLDSEKTPSVPHHQRSGHVRALTAVPVLISVSSLNEWSTVL